MIKNKAGEFIYFKYKNLSSFENVDHFVTTRIGGDSKNPYEHSNMSLMVGDDSETVINNRLNFLSQMNIQAQRCVFADLRHGTNIKIIKNTPREMFNGFYIAKNVDAMISDIPNICLLVTAADCIPISIFDKNKKVIGVVHAGWKGSVAEISFKVIEKMKNVFGSNPKDIFIGLGPSICVNDYEVGDEVIKCLDHQLINNKQIVKHVGDKYHLSLEKLNIYQFLKSGIPSKNIESSGYCTYENNNLFYSNRRESQTGRFMSGIILNNE